MGLLFLAVLLASCASGTTAPDRADSPTARPIKTASPVPPDEPASPALADPVRIEVGTPYGGDELLDAMRDSMRPGGVPDAIATPEVAARVAESLLTIDGEPWTAFSVGGACGQAECSLEVVGVRDDASGEDIWRFRVEPATGRVDVADRELGATPVPLTEALDRMARRLVEPDLPPGLFLATVRWLPPPDDGVFHLAYRSGNEEESCAVDLELDAVRVAIVGVRTTDC